MYPPRGPDDTTRPTDEPRTWGGLVTVTALVVAVPFALWTAANITPGVAAAAVAALSVVAYAATRHTGETPVEGREPTRSDSDGADHRRTRSDTSPDRDRTHPTSLDDPESSDPRRLDRRPAAVGPDPVPRAHRRSE
jgi:hypothetical protein